MTITTYKLRDRHTRRFRNRSRRLKTHGDTETNRKTLVRTTAQDIKDSEVETKIHRHADLQSWGAGEWEENTETHGQKHTKT